MRATAATSWPSSFDLEVDVTTAAALNEKLSTRVTVVLPDPSLLGSEPIVCFGFPGGGYSRGYYTFDMPGAEGGGGQAGWHAERGWVFVACDHLGVGESSLSSDPANLTFTPSVAANHETAHAILEQLAAGTVSPEFPPLTDPIVLGIGQSMGGCSTVVQQGRHRTFDGIGVLGFSAFFTNPVGAPGSADPPRPWVPRDAHPSDPVVINSHMFEPGSDPWARRPGVSWMAWCFYYDDVPEEIVRADLEDFPTRRGQKLPWASPTRPGFAVWVTTPGAIAPEAAAVEVPVLIASGERDVVPDPQLEPKAYRSASDISVFVCPRMGHMHNFASTRELFWARIEAWGRGVGRLRDVNHTLRS